MIKVIYAIIDNHNAQRKTKYDFLFRSSDYDEFQKYIKEKGLN